MLYCGDHEQILTHTHTHIYVNVLEFVYIYVCIYIICHIYTDDIYTHISCICCISLYNLSSVSPVWFASL